MRPFWQELVLNVAGPLTAALIGTFLLGITASYLTRRWQERKEDAELRESLIRELLETASALYLQLRQFEYLADHHEPWRDMQAERKTLDDVYVHARTAGDAIEGRLLAHFESEELGRSWHAMKDLLTARYLQLVGAPRDSLASVEGPNHSTLSLADLESLDLIYERYQFYARHLPREILTAPRRARSEESRP